MDRKHWLTLSIVLMAVDQALKALLGQTNLILIPGILALRGTRNTGAAFSMLSDSPLLVMLLSIALLIALLVFANKMLSHRLMALSFCMIFGGALGNLADRLFRGYVVDYIEVLFINFPVFNFADILITIGAFLLALAVLCMPKEQA